MRHWYLVALVTALLLGCAPPQTDTPAGPTAPPLPPAEPAALTGIPDPETAASADAVIMPDGVFAEGPENKYAAVAAGDRIFFVGGAHDRLMDTLYQYRIGPGELTEVAQTTFQEGQLDVPDTDGTWVTWLDWAQFGPEQGHWTVFARPVAGGETVIIASTRDGPEPRPAVDGELPEIGEPVIDQGRVVWAEETADGLWAVHLYVLNTGREELLTPPGQTVAPKIGGDWVVYGWGEPDAEGSALSLRAYNLVSKQTRELLTGQPVLRYFRTQAGRVCLVQGELPDYWENRLYLTLFDLESGTVNQLTEHSREAGTIVPDISDRFVVWLQDPFYYLHVYDVATGRRLRISTPERNARWPRIRGRVLTWNRSGKESDEIVWVTLPE